MLVTVLNIPLKKLNEIYVVSLTSLTNMRNEKKWELMHMQGIDALVRRVLMHILFLRRKSRVNSPGLVHIPIFQQILGIFLPRLF